MEIRGDGPVGVDANLAGGGDEAGGQTICVFFHLLHALSLSLFPTPPLFLFQLAQNSRKFIASKIHCTLEMHKHALKT